MKSNKILILGNGYIGNHLYNHLKGKEFLVELKSSKELDYHNTQEIGKYILNNDVNTVINCSGFTGKPNVDEGESKKELCWKLNVTSPKNVNSICNKLGVNYLHISSGCIYENYLKKWDESDVPNFGLFQNHSSFYSKSKHGFELVTEDMNGIILRIRMPFTPDHSGRNYLHKIGKYNDLVNFQNSKTYIPDLCVFIENLLIKKNTSWVGREIYNVVNPVALTTEEVCEIMRKYGFHNDNWKFVDISKLPIIAGRSNCVLENTKADEIYKLQTEREALEDCLNILKNNSDKNRLEAIKNLEEKY